MFYDIYCEICREHKISPSAAAIACGISKSAVSTWKNARSTPQLEQIQKIADYFGVSLDRLCGNEKTPAAEIGSERVQDEFVAFYGDVKKELTQVDIADIKKLMQIRAELNRDKR